MRYNAWATVLIGLSALCLTACGSTRQATSSHSEQELRVESVERRDSSEVERIEVLDTLKEVTTITVQVNEAGDALRQSIVTDRLHSRDRSQLRDQRVETKVIRDTVYIEKRDSSLQVTAYGLQEDGTPTVSGKLSAVSKILKWILAIIIGLIGLVITVKVCLLRK